MANCEMCGWIEENLENLKGRWYVYDNGEQFIATVCMNCQSTHKRLVGAK